MHAMVHGPMWAQWLFQLSVVLIIASYLWIAWQFWDARNNVTIGVGDGIKAKGALGELVAIFVLCAFSGYVPKLLFKAFPDLVPDFWIPMLVSHVTLSFWALKYAFGRQASHIMARLN